MRKILLLLTWVFFVVYANSQFAIKGVIKDENGKALLSATVSLLKSSDSSTIKFALSDKDGRYNFSNLDKGKYFVVATSVGYNKIYSPEIILGNSNADLSELTLMHSKNQLNNVTVTASRSFIEMHLDRMVINVEASPTNVGANLLEVLTKSPGIMIDKEENISLNGKQGVLILIDGRKTYLDGKDLATLLKSMPASEIDQIEIMPTPPAKYEAEGMAGVINIKTKKTRNDGWNGSVNASMMLGYFKDNKTTYLFPGPQAGINFNYKKKKVNFSGSLSIASYQGKGISNYDKIYYAENGLVNGYTYFSVNGKYKGNYAPLQFGVDYNPDKKNVVGVSLSTMLLSSSSQPRNRTSQLFDANRQLIQNSSGHQKQDYGFNRFTSNINWKHSIDTLGQEVSFDADYVNYNFPTNISLINEYYTNTTLDRSTYLNNNSHRSTDISAFKSDYIKPLKNGRFEAGIKTSFVNTHLKNEFFRFINNKWQFDSTLYNRFLYKENISAAYINLNRQIKKWSLQGGLRFEQMHANGKQVIRNYSLSRNNGGLFPSTFASYAINKNNTVKGSYTRRINRPQFYSLMPYLVITDSLDIWHGNPDLKPEHSNNMELSYALKNQYFFTLSYVVTKDVIRYVAGQIGTQKATEFFPINIDKLRNLSLTISSPVKPAKWWDINMFTSVFANKYYNWMDGNVSKSYYTLSQNITNTFKIAKGLKGELDMNYMTKQVDQMFETHSLLNNFSIGLQKQIMKENGSLTLTVNDPFQWYNYRYSAHFIRMYEVGTSHYQSRSVVVGFSYRFGKVNNQGRQHTTASQEEQNR